MQFDKIANWSEGDLRRYIVNLLLSDPGALPKEVSGPSQQLPSGANDGDVPVWNSASNSWTTSTARPDFDDNALATPVLRFQSSNTGIGGQAAGSYQMVNGNPRTAGTLANALVPQFRYEPTLDDPPSGYKTQWQLVVVWETNATAPGGTHIHAPWAITGAGGGAGGYTQTMAGSFTSVQANLVTPAANQASVVESGWTDHGAASMIQSNTNYVIGVNYSAILAANSAIQVHAQVYRRFIPV